MVASIETVTHLALQWAGVAALVAFTVMTLRLGGWLFKILSPGVGGRPDVNWLAFDNGSASDVATHLKTILDAALGAAPGTITEAQRFTVLGMLIAVADPPPAKDRANSHTRIASAATNAAAADWAAVINDLNAADS